MLLKKSLVSNCGKTRNQRIGHPVFPSKQASSLTTTFSVSTLESTRFIQSQVTTEQTDSFANFLKKNIPIEMPKRKPEDEEGQQPEQVIDPKKTKQNGDATSNGKTEIEYDDLHGVGDLKDVSDFDISPQIQKLLAAKGITKLFPIQSAAFSAILAGKDMIGRARTGTGKTLAFAIPTVEKLLRTMTDKDFYRGRYPRVLVLTPTRELCKQVCNDLDYLSGDKIKTISIYGGTSYDPQEYALRNGVDVVVGTPGRMQDLLEKGSLKLQDIQHVILDEADEMLDMGFADDIEKILKNIPKRTTEKYQVMLFSATIPPWIKDVARKYLNPDYITVDLVGNSRTKSANTISHMALLCVPSQKNTILGDLVKVYGKSGKTIIFVEKKSDAAELTTNSLLSGISQALHGDIQQTQREIALKGFKEGRFSVLIATDVAARGLDIPNVDLVINFTPPKDVDSYIHRVGRTGRAGKKGASITLFTNREVFSVKNIEAKVGIEFSRISAPSVQKVIEGSAEKALEALKKIDERAADHFMEIAKKFVEEKGDGVRAVALALAQITGYTSPVMEKSLLGALPGYSTLRLFTKTPIRSPGFVLSVMRPFTDSVKEIKVVEGGAVFDVPTDIAKEIVSQYSKRSYGDKIELCTELPAELATIEDSGSYGGGYGGGQRRSYGGSYTSRGGSGYPSGGDRYGGSSGGSSDRRSSGSYGGDRRSDSGYGRPRTYGDKY